MTPGLKWTPEVPLAAFQIFMAPNGKEVWIWGVLITNQPLFKKLIKTERKHLLSVWEGTAFFLPAILLLCHLLTAVQCCTRESSVHSWDAPNNMADGWGRMPVRVMVSSKVHEYFALPIFLPAWVGIKHRNCQTNAWKTSTGSVLNFRF